MYVRRKPLRSSNELKIENGKLKMIGFHTSNEVMRSMDVCCPRATELVLLSKLGGNEVFYYTTTINHNNHSGDKTTTTINHNNHENHSSDNWATIKRKSAKIIKICVICVPMATTIASPIIFNSQFSIR
jgi:hypothetical protein